MEGSLTRRKMLQLGLASAGGLLFSPALLMGPAAAQTSETTWLDAFRAIDTVFVRSLEFSSNGLYRVPSRAATAAPAVAAQMGAVLTAVTEAQAKATQLTGGESEYLKLRFHAAEFGTLIDTADQYRRQLGGEATPLDLAAIRRAVGNERVRLVDSAQGIGPEAAALLPLALAAEFGAATRLETDRAAMRAALAPYEDWIARIRSARNGSILDHRQIAEASHDGSLSEVAQTHLGRRLGLSNFLLAGNQAAGRTADPCVLLNKNWVTHPNLDERGAITPTPAQSTWIRSPELTPNVMLGHSRIAVRDDHSLGARLIQFQPSRGPGHYLAPHYIFWPGVGNEYCYVGRSEVALEPAQALAVAAELPGVKDDAEVRPRIVAAVNQANAARVQIAICGKALQLLEDVEARIAYHRRIEWV